MMIIVIKNHVSRVIILVKAAHKIQIIVYHVFTDTICTTIPAIDIVLYKLGITLILQHVLIVHPNVMIVLEAVISVLIVVLVILCIIKIIHV